MHFLDDKVAHIAETCDAQRFPRTHLVEAAEVLKKMPDDKRAFFEAEIAARRFNKQWLTDASTVCLGKMSAHYVAQTENAVSGDDDVSHVVKEGKMKERLIYSRRPA